MRELSQLRLERGMSQGKLAKAAGISRSTISYIEKNKPNLNLDILQKLAEGLGVTLDYLLSE